MIQSGTARPFGPGAASRPPGASAPLLWVHGDESVHGWTDIPGSRSEVAVFHFQPVDPLLAMSLNRENGSVLTLTESQAQSIRVMAREAVSLGSERGLEARLKLEKICVDLSLMIAPCLSGMERSVMERRDHWIVEQTCTLFRERLEECPTLSSLAEDVGVSVPHLRRVFVRSRGLSPHRVLTRIRMDTAREWLASGEWTVSEVSHMVGYSEPSAFSRAFKQLTGIAPSSINS